MGAFLSTLQAEAAARLAEAEAAARLAEAEAAARAADGDGAVFAMLDGFAALGRDIAQRSWLAHHDDEDRDDLMQAACNDLVVQARKMPFSEVYPELPAQVEAVLRDTFDDEHFRLEDPEGWAGINDEGPGGSGVLQ